MSNKESLEALQILMRNSYSAVYITIETKYTISHLERLLGSCNDRGRWKWIAETKMNEIDHETQEGQKSWIDGGDMFPRLYFHDVAFLMEFDTWLTIRGLTITDIQVPKI